MAVQQVPLLLYKGNIHTQFSCKNSTHYIFAELKPPGDPFTRDSVIFSNVTEFASFIKRLFRLYALFKT